MKKLTMLTIAAAVLTTLSLSAADDAKPKRAKQQIPAEIVKKYDKNNDGKIDKSDNLTKEERKAMQEEIKKSRETK
jgi:hypothetical protein